MVTCHRKWRKNFRSNGGLTTTVSLPLCSCGKRDYGSVSAYFYGLPPSLPAAEKIARAIVQKSSTLGEQQEPAQQSRKGDLSWDPSARVHQPAVLFTVNVNIAGKEGRVALDVRDGDVPKVLATAFARKHNLYGAARDRITQTILDKAARIRDEGSAAVAATAADGGGRDKDTAAAAAAAAAADGGRGGDSGTATTNAGVEPAATNAQVDQKVPLSTTQSKEDESKTTDAVHRPPPKGKFVVSLEVTLDSGVVLLAIHEGDNPIEVARTFAGKYGLGEDAVAQLTAAVAHALAQHHQQQAEARHKRDRKE
eukprot:COSAG05_NODE_4676_length_1415_cov_1.250760_1_plen_309_part_10